MRFLSSLFALDIIWLIVSFYYEGNKPYNKAALKTECQLMPLQFQLRKNSQIEDGLMRL